MADAPRFTDEEALDLEQLTQELAYRIGGILNRRDRQTAIRNIGKGLYAIHRNTGALRDLMDRTVELKPESERELFGDFNAALDGIGGWRC